MFTFVFLIPFFLCEKYLFRHCYVLRVQSSSSALLACDGGFIYPSDFLFENLSRQLLRPECLFFHRVWIRNSSPNLLRYLTYNINFSNLEEAFPTSPVDRIWDSSPLLFIYTHFAVVTHLLTLGSNSNCLLMNHGHNLIFTVAFLITSS